MDIKRHIKHNRQLVYDLYLPAILVLCTGIGISIFLFLWITDKQQLQIKTKLKRAATNYAVVIQMEKNHFALKRLLKKREFKQQFTFEDV